MHFIFFYMIQFQFVKLLIFIFNTTELVYNFECNISQYCYNKKKCFINRPTVRRRVEF